MSQGIRIEKPDLEKAPPAPLEARVDSKKNYQALIVLTFLFSTLSIALAAVVYTQSKI